MRKFTAALACIGMLSSAGCSTIRDELRYPGGAPGRLLDQRTFDSSRSKQLQLLRATLALAIAARIGEASVATEDADAFARQLAEASRELNYAAVDAGYPFFKTTDEGVVRAEPCMVETPGEDMIEALSPENTYLMIDGQCPGYMSILNRTSHGSNRGLSGQCSRPCHQIALVNFWRTFPRGICCPPFGQ